MINITITSPPIYTLTIETKNMDNGKKLLDHLKSEFIALSRKSNASINILPENLVVTRPTVITIDNVVQKDWIGVKSLFFELSEADLEKF